MTKLEKPLTRETAAAHRGDPIVIVLHPKYLQVRLKGKRDGMNVDYETLLDFARKLTWKRGGKVR